MVGKSGVGSDIIKQANDALTARELIKGKVLETAPHTVRDTAGEIAEKTQAQVVQVIGTKFVLYRPNLKEPKIVLPKAKKV